MLCANPYIRSDMTPIACSQCDQCRARRKKLWANRIMLESFKHGDSSFITLTYDDDHLPEGGSLQPKDAQDWLKRLRKAIYPRQMRYFLAGEYGDHTWRPHYHLAAFGLSLMDENIVRETWGFGHVVVGTLNPASAQYVAGYVTKKMTGNGDARLAGRHPEFIRMSLRPGIGALAVEDIGRVLMTDHGLDHLAESGDVPFMLHYGKEGMTLGRYLRGKLREYMGFGSKDVPKEALGKWQEEMRRMYKENVCAPEKTSGARKLQWKMKILDMDAQKLRNAAKRREIFQTRKEL